MPKAELKKSAASNRNIVAVSLTPIENDIVDELIEHVGMSKQELVRRGFAWFSLQDDCVQKLVLGIGPRGASGNAAMVGMLRKLADEIERGPFTPPASSSAGPLTDLHVGGDDPPKPAPPGSIRSLSRSSRPSGGGALDEEEEDDDDTGTSLGPKKRRRR